MTSRLVEEDAEPLLTAEEEMQYQRALWVNRLLKEQLALQTQGLSIKEIEEAQAQIQAKMRGAARSEAWPSGPGARPLHSLRAAGARSLASAPSSTAHSALNRRRRDEKIRQENSSFLRRLESVKSSFTPRVNPAFRIPKLSPCSRLLAQAREF